MNIELNDEQVEVLRSLLETNLRELSYEISSADRPAFRLMLRGRRETIRSILDALAEVGPIAQPSLT